MGKVQGKCQTTKKNNGQKEGKTAKRKGQEEEMQSHVKDMFA